MSKRSNEWAIFALDVIKHIDNYTVPQYGDKGSDQITDYTAEDCIKQARKYLARFGSNARPGQERLDMLKAAHYIGVAATKMQEASDNGPAS